MSLLWAAAGIWLCACVSAPATPPPQIDVDAGKVSREYSSFNARVISQAAELEQSFTTSLDPNQAPVTRLESGVKYRLEDHGAAVHIGDTVSSGGWGGAVRYGGVQFGTAVKRRTDVLVASELAAPGLAMLPALDEALFASIDGDRDAFADRRLSVNRSLNLAGQHPWTLKAKDQFGRSAAIDAPIVTPIDFAAPGCAQFAVDAGRVRRDYAIVSNEYGPAYAGATLACGAPLGFTVEGRGEYLQHELASVGIEVARPLGVFGAASAALASSRAESGEEGWLARFGFERRSERLTLAWRRDLQSRAFREIAGVVRDDPVMQRDLASIGVNVADGASLSLAYAAQTTWSRTRSDMVALQQQIELGRGSLAMSAAHSLEENFGSTIMLSYKRPLGFTRQRRSSVAELDPILVNGLQ